jgi:quinol-cytochrome oxidoreductase complex cytochrome b subunit
MSEFMGKWSAFILDNSRLLSIILFSYFTVWNLAVSIWMRKNISKNQRYRYLWKGYFLISIGNVLWVLQLATKPPKFIATVIGILFIVLLSCGLFIIFRKIDMKKEHQNNLKHIIG